MEFWCVLRLVQLPIKLVARGAIGKHGWHEFGGGADGALELNGGGGSEKTKQNSSTLKLRYNKPQYSEFRDVVN